MRIDSRHQTLCSSLFITRRTIDLTGKEKPLNDTGFQRIMKILRVKVIILHRICRLKDNALLETRNSMQGVQLHIKRQRGRETLEIVFIIVPAFRLQEQLV